MLPNVQEAHVHEQMGVGTVGDDRRREPRVPAPPGIELEANGNAVRLVDLSPRGAQVISPGILRPKARVRMVWRGEDTEAKLSGVIAWSVLEVREGSPVYRAGIEFDEPVPLFLESELSRSPETTPAPESKTLLIVEDDGPVRNLLVRVLAHRGYTVLQAANGAEALDLLSSHPELQLIIADVEMPVMDGLGLIGRLQGRPCASKLLLISGCADLSSTRIYGRTWPFLAKPFTAPVLLQNVQRVLEAN